MKTFSLFQASLAATCSVFLADAMTASAQTSIYHTNGFEAPRFSTGQLADEQFQGQGQEDWIVTAGGGAVNVDQIVVQSSVTYAGGQAATLAATGQPASLHLRKNVIYDVASRPAEQVVDIRARIRIDSSANPSGSWAHQAQAGPGPGSGIFTWDIHEDGRIHYTDGTTGAEIDSTFVFTRDVWHDVLTSVDYTTGRYAVWIDGLPVFEADALSGVGHGLFAFHSFALFGAGDDQMHFDNYELSTRPVGDPVFGFGTNYCGPANTNSVGTSAEIASTGSRSASQNNLQLNASGMPAHSFGLFIASQTQGFVMSPGGSQGNLCLAGNVSRFMHQVQQSNNAGTFSIPVDLTAIPTPGGTVAVQAGETWNFQAWYRDANPSATSNFTNGISVTFE